MKVRSRSTYCKREKKCLALYVIWVELLEFGASGKDTKEVYVPRSLDSLRGWARGSKGR